MKQYSEYFLHISIRLLINLLWIVQVNLNFHKLREYRWTNYKPVLWNSSKVHLTSIWQHKLQILKVDFYIFIFAFVPTFFVFSISQWHCNVIIYFFGQTTNRSVTVNHIQSFSINILHTVMYTFVHLKNIHKKSSPLHFSTVTVIQTVAMVYIR